MTIPEGRIETHTGQWVDPFDLDQGKVCVEDVAFALANECRFGGHVRRCVADHSRLVQRILGQWGEPARTQRLGLVHDAHEYVLRDLPRPVKLRPEFAAYRAACDRAQATILAALDIAPPSKDDAALVKRADELAMLFEAEGDLPSRGREWSCATPEFLLEADALRGSGILWELNLMWLPQASEEYWLDDYFDLREASV